jgi:reactive intermediate/imine deaminase
MMKKEIIQTNDAPQAIGTYSQAVRVDNTVYLSGQIPLDAETMTLIDGDIAEQTRKVFQNLNAVCVAAGGDLSHIVKLNVYLKDFNNFAVINKVMAEFIEEPYPARAAIGVAELPKGAEIEIEGVMVL